MPNASSMPFCPPKARPMAINSSVIAVSRRAVLNVFPIENTFDSLDAAVMRRIRQVADGRERPSSTVGGKLALRFLGFPLECALQGLVLRGLGFVVLLLRNAALFMIEFQLEELFFQGLKQHVGSRSGRGCARCRWHGQLGLNVGVVWDGSALRAS